MYSKSTSLCIFLGLLACFIAETSLGQDADGDKNELAEYGIVPTYIDMIPPGQITVVYGSARVTEGNSFVNSQVQNQPKITYSANASAMYTVAVVNLDNVDANLEVLLYLVINIPGSKVSKGQVPATYQAPGQRVNQQRILHVLYQQSRPIQDLTEYDITGRRGFELRKFATEQSLGEPVGANFYILQSSLINPSS